jgi:HemY protein
VTGRIDAFEWKVPLEEVSGARPVLENRIQTEARLADGARSARPALDTADSVAKPQPEPVAPAAEPKPPTAPIAPEAAAPAVDAAPLAPTDAPTVSPDSAKTAVEPAAEPVTPLQHAPDDPGPEPEAEEAEPEAPPRPEGWRFGSLFR